MKTGHWDNRCSVPLASGNRERLVNANLCDYFEELEIAICRGYRYNKVAARIGARHQVSALWRSVPKLPSAFQDLRSLFVTVVQRCPVRTSRMVVFPVSAPARTYEVFNSAVCGFARWGVAPE